MVKTLSTLPVLVFLALSAPSAFAQPQPPATAPQGYYWHGPWHMGADGAWPFWAMLPMMALFIVAIGALIFCFSRRDSAGGTHHAGPPSGRWGDPSHSALQVLNERFARGEIQKDEYAEKKAILLSSGPR